MYLFTAFLMVLMEVENSPMSKLIHGDWSVIFTTYTQTLGPAYHVLVFLLGPTLVGIKYQRFAPVAMIMLVTSIPFGVFFQTPIQFIFAAAAILGFAGVLYSVVHK
jgi:hypothetical protein